MRKQSHTSELFEIHINGDDMLCGVYLINRQLQTIFVFAITLIALVKT